MTELYNRTFCSAKCTDPDCPLRWTAKLQDMVKPGAKVKFENFSKNCLAYKPPKRIKRLGATLKAGEVNG